MRYLWRKPLWLVLAGGGLFLTVDLTFFAANLTKVLHGGWFPLSIALVVFVVLTTWQRGREIVTRNRTEEEGPLRTFVDEVRAMDPPVTGPPRTGVFLNANLETTPLALRENLEHNLVVHACVVIVSVETLRVPARPRVRARERRRPRLPRRRHHPPHRHASAFRTSIDVPSTLRMAADQHRGRRSTSIAPPTSSRASRSCRTKAPGMAMWRKKLFVVIARNAANPVAYFGLPDDRTIVMASHIEL